MSALLFGVYSKGPDLWKLPFVLVRKVQSTRMLTACEFKSGVHKSFSRGRRFVSSGDACRALKGVQ